MPVHDWTTVRAGIFHDFHHEWLRSIKHALNHGILPSEYYAMVDQHAGDFMPDVLTLEQVDNGTSGLPARRSNGGMVLAKPRRKAIAETDLEPHRRRKKMVTIRHVSDDNVVAAVEIMSPGNKSSRRSLAAFVDKVARLLEQEIHVLIVDVLPPGRRDPQGIHGAIWAEIARTDYRSHKRKNLTAVSYEAGDSVRAYVEHFALGDPLPAMPLFLEPGGCVEVPLEQTYCEAFAEVPKRWRERLRE